MSTTGNRCASTGPSPTWNPSTAPSSICSSTRSFPFPHVAFASEEGQDFDDWYITRSEAVALLDELRARHYVLVSLADCFVHRGHAVVPNPELRVPRGHNPLVLSIDDLSFNRFLPGKGFMDRIIIDSTGHLSSIGKDPSTGRQFKEPTNCIVGLLDGYLRAHPEFSLNGAAATLAFTGYEGILGLPNRPSRAQPGRPTGGRQAHHRPHEETGVDLRQSLLRTHRPGFETDDPGVGYR